MPDIVNEIENIEPKEEISYTEQKVSIINSIKDKHKDLRQASKPVTFALTYMGTFATLMENCGFNEEEAKKIEKAYHDLYQVSDKYCEERVEEAKEKGYIEVAFGLRIRCPLLKFMSSSHLAQQEVRTINNAMGQSYCTLTLRAAVAFNSLIRELGLEEYIVPCLTIHDALYYYVYNDVKIIKLFNDLIVQCFKWQEDTNIKHDSVHLGGEVSIFYPDWAHETSIKNNATEEEIINAITK